MIIFCPQCSTSYNINDNQINPNGRKVRCKSCKHVWFQAPERQDQISDQLDSEYSAIDENADHPADSDYEDRSKHREPSLNTDAEQPVYRTYDDKPRDTSLEAEASRSTTAFTDEEQPVNWKGWASFAAAVVAIIAFMVVQREWLVVSWPATAKIYEAFGVVVMKPGKGLEIKNLVPMRKTTEQGVVLVIEGEVHNMVDDVVTVPRIRLLMADEQGKTIQEVTQDPENQKLLPGENTKFHAEIPNPDPAATKLDVQFVAR